MKLTGLPPLPPDAIGATINGVHFAREEYEAMMTDTTRVCPICGHEYCLQLCNVGGLGNPTNVTAMVKCASCGEVRHWSHWKTPAEHHAADTRVKALSDAVRSGEEPKAAVDRIFNE